MLVASVATDAAVSSHITGVFGFIQETSERVIHGNQSNAYFCIQLQSILSFQRQTGNCQRSRGHCEQLLRAVRPTDQIQRVRIVPIVCSG